VTPLEVHHEAEHQMDNMAVAHINVKTLKAARDRLGVGLEKLATKTYPVEKLKAWEDGEHLPTEDQAQWLANRLGIPYLVLFLDALPDLDSLPLPDLRTRTLSGEFPRKPSRDFIDTVNNAMRRQDWYRDYQRDINARSLPFVGAFSQRDSPAIVAADIRSRLNITPQFRRSAGSWEEFNRSFIRQAESVGVLVMRNGVVEHATNRKLSTSEFRGFASSDSLAPLVFINDRDARAAQNFTLAHELAHIWIGQSGISNAPLGHVVHTPDAGIERFCNQVAAEVLVPEKDVRPLWNSAQSIAHNTQRITYQYRVSTLMALVRAYELSFISYELFRSEFDMELNRIRADEERRRRKEKEEQKKQRGDFWATFRLRTSERFSQALSDGVRRDITSYKEAASLLGVNLRTFETFIAEMA
jgi:Zn-dependent peptidase ImmA (M78 family)